MKDNNSLSFEKEKFLKLFQPPWSEGPRLDYKQEVFPCRSDKEKFKFSKILIALANVSRRTGKESFILFGVTDKVRKLVDVQDQFVGNRNSGIWDNPNVDFHTKQTECVIDQLIKIANEWIAPEIPNFNYEYGDVNEKFVSYMIIRPTPTSRPFSLKRQFENFREGTIFVRKGSNSLPVNPSEVENILQLSSSAYLSRQDWEQIIEFQLTGDFEKSNNLYPSVDLYVNTDPPMAALSYIKEKVQKIPQKLILVGNLGMGKSVLLRKLAFSIAQAGKDSILSLRTYYGQDDQKYSDDDWITSIANEVEVHPQTIVPLFFNLRFAFSTEKELEAYLTKKIHDNIGIDLEFGIGSLFSIPESKWILFLDGLDELRVSQTSGPILRTWIEKLPDNVSVCISSRPNNEFSDLCEEINIAPLDESNIKEFIINSLISILGNEINDYEQNPIDGVSRWLENNQEIYPLINNLRAIQGFLNLFISHPQSTVEIDADKVVPKVKIYTEAKETVYSSKDTDLPRITESILEGDDSFLNLEEDNNSDYNELKRIIMPTLALAYQYIIDYIQKEEEKRRLDFGIISEYVANKARSNLERIAWKSNWSKNNINMSRFPENYLDQSLSCWYKETGFFVTQSSTNQFMYKYACTTLMYFFAAEFAFLTIETVEEIKSKIRKKYPISAIKIVMLMTNQLRMENGKREFTFSFLEA